MQVYYRMRAEGFPSRICYGRASPRRQSSPEELLSLHNSDGPTPHEGTLSRAHPSLSAGSRGSSRVYLRLLAGYWGGVGRLGNLRRDTIGSPARGHGSNCRLHAVRVSEVALVR